MQIIVTILHTAAPNDYSAQQNLLTFTSGVNVSCTTVVPIIDDAVLEDNQTFSVVLSTADPDALLDPASATVAIVDNDGEIALASYINADIENHYSLHPVITVGLQQSSYIVSEGDQELIICTILSGRIEREVVFSVSTEDGSAKSEYNLIQLNTCTCNI